MSSSAGQVHPSERSYAVPHSGRRRVLIESADRALAVSDFRFLVDAGFEVATCAGPGHDATSCPLLRGETCELVTQADVVVHALDPDLHIAAAIKRARPELPVIVQRPRVRQGEPRPVPDGCVALDMPCSVTGQLEAVRRAVGPG
jgi:hypothetical protein